MPKDLSNSQNCPIIKEHMTLKVYLWGLRLSTILALSGWILVIYFIDPQKLGIGGQLLFYFSFFLALSGILILMFTRLRRKKDDEEATFSSLGMSFRQGILLALLAIILLVLQSFRVLVWWDGLMAVAAIFLVELYFLSR
jgi:hypothetical protein